MKKNYLNTKLGQKQKNKKEIMTTKTKNIITDDHLSKNKSFELELEIILIMIKNLMFFLVIMLIIFITLLILNCKI